MIMLLNADQEIAARRFHEWWVMKNKPTFEISGKAGTGKTTLIKYLIESEGLDLDDVIFVAYVGKATLALQKQGLYATTIHNAFYNIYHVILRDDNGDPILKDDGTVALAPRFEPKENLPENIKLIVVDEGSMVPISMCDHILSYKIPVVVLGDLNQLEPVFGKSQFLKTPDAILNQIMRQSEESPIPYFADKVLRGEYIREGFFDDKGLVRVICDSDRLSINYSEADVVICGINKTRKILNHFIRNYVYGLRSKDPDIGDRIICRKNNWAKVNDDQVPLVNGMVGVITDINYEKLTKNMILIDFQPDDFPTQFTNVTLDRSIFTKDAEVNKLKMQSAYDVFEYGYAITCHLAQGSQYNNVVVKYEPFGNARTRQKWLYTAVTRAIDRLTLII